MIRSLATVFAAWLLAGCTGADAPPSGRAGAASHPTRTESLGELLTSSDYDLVAGGVHEGPALAAADVLADPAEFVGKNPLRVEGEIVAVCQQRGCWIDVGSASASMHVTFAAGCRDFVRLDAAGRTVLLEGELRVVEQSVAEQKHLAEDAGRPEEAAMITEPVRRVTFVATGAAVRK